MKLIYLKLKTNKIEKKANNTVEKYEKLFRTVDIILKKC